MTRRTLLGSVGAATMFPPLAAGVTSPAPPVPQPALEIGLRIGAPRTGRDGWRHADVLAGLVRGGLMQGTVQSGQLQWLVDPASGAVEVAIDMSLLRADGAQVRLRDRSVHADATLAEWPGLPTAPQLFDATGATLLAPAQLAGRLDASGIARGVMWLRAFDQG